MSVIAIDGPAGAGKSTVAKLVAERMGWQHLDTGAMYRALALAVLRAGADPSSEEDVAEVASSVNVEVEGARVLLNGDDVTASIREPRVTEAVATVSGHLRGRQALVTLQRGIATHQDVVMEGRDIGTEVFPEAELKIFLTASLNERAERRWKETRDTELSREEIELRIAERDEADSSRPVSPLRRADDALDIDSSDKSIEEVVTIIVDAARTKGLNRTAI